MPVSIILPISSSLCFSSNGIVGVNAPVLSGAISLGVSTWSSTPSNIVLNGATSGVAGIGSVTGKLTVPPNPALYESAFVANGLVGLQKTPLCIALSTAVSVAFSTALYQGSSQGVGVGVDTSKVVSANRASLISVLNSTFASNGIVGVNSSVLATAISTGISNHLLTGFGNGAVLGSPSIFPSVGSSICNLVI